MNPNEGVRFAALNAVFDQKRKKPTERDPEYFLRKVFRWYSATYATPLHVVDELPLHDILQNFWENHYESMLEEHPGEKPGSGFQRLDQARRDLLEDPEVLAERQRLEDEDEVVSFEMLEEQRQADMEEATKTAVDALQRATDALSGLGPPKPQKPVPEAQGKPEISIKFVDDLHDDEDPLLMFGLLDSPKSR